MNSTETKMELPRDWQIFREANSSGQWSDWKLNTSGKNLPSHDYRECAHVREVLKGDDILRKRLEAVEKERDELMKDKERLDWLEHESIILNKLFGSPDAVKTFYHIFRKGKHFGGCETALLNLRQTIDKATAEAMKGELKTTHTIYEANNGDD